MEKYVLSGSEGCYKVVCCLLLAKTLPCVENKSASVESIINLRTGTDEECMENS